MENRDAILRSIKNLIQELLLSSNLTEEEKKLALTEAVTAAEAHEQRERAKWKI